ncbi:MAG TPA: LacI family DNA-binding transcriptional regulator [Terriglobales bacterium]|nr:LacI family DNA-binding transcriptional regulator [Terriglobales bacterium]
MTVPVTMRQIAERAGVSIGTVSHVINQTATVRPQLRERVIEAIRSMGYQPSALAQGLRKNRTNMLGMVIPDITNPFFPGVVRGVEDVAYKRSFRVILCNADNDSFKEASYVRELRSYHIAGLLIIPAVGGDIASHLRTYASASVPVVCMDRVPDGWKGDAVLVANREGAYLATRHLIQAGHRRLAIIAGPLGLTNADERLKGFRRALKEARIEIEPEFVREASFDTESGYQAALQLLHMLPRPTAIFACNDLMAFGVLQAARELGLRCPEDLSIAGFDSLELTKFTAPPLTSVYQPGYQLGATAARLLMQRIDGLRSAPKRVLLPTELKKRNSVGPPHASASDGSERKSRVGKRARGK